jgi:putative transposase
MTGISKSQVSRLVGEIDEKVHAFLNRPIEGSIPMKSVPRTNFLNVRGTFGGVDGPISGSTLPM